MIFLKLLEKNDNILRNDDFQKLIEALKNRKNLTIDNELHEVYNKFEEREKFVMSIENSNDDSEMKENRHISLVCYKK
jgi:hypothetical protein